MKNRKLFEARRRKSLSIADAAAAVGTVERTYQRWEHGESFPQPYFRRKLCDFYGVSLDELGLDREASTDRAQQSDVTDAVSPVPKGTILTLTAQEVRDISEMLRLGEGDMKQFDHSKRETLEKLARAAKVAAGVAVGDQVLINPEPWDRLARAVEKPSILNFAALEKFKTLLAD